MCYNITMAAHIIQPYIDAGELAFKQANANGVFEGAKDLLSRYIGEVTLLPLRQVRSPLNATTVDPSRLISTMKRSPHVALLTRRKIVVPDGTLPPETLRRGLDGICYFRNPEKRLLGSLAIASVDKLSMEPDIDEAVATMTHELAHGLGLDHCEESGCIMRPQLSDVEKVLLSVSASQFCLDHTAELSALKF